MLLMIIGGLDIFQGLVAVIRDQYYIGGDNGTLVIDVSQWGWIMMIWGAALLLVGYGLLSGASWARWVAILGVSVNFLVQLSYDGHSQYTLWSLCVVALNIIILYALIARWDEAKAGAGL
jgi:predicted membrane metal-binding protein